MAIRPYLVTGDDAASLRRSVDVARPTDPHDGQRVDALTHWSMTWRWPGRRHGGCDLRAAKLTFRATVMLPRLADRVALPPEVAADWTRYTLALERHEAGHVRYAHARRGAVLAAIRGATCATAERAARAVLATIAAHDVAYDRATRHGMAEGASFPACSIATGAQQSGCMAPPEPETIS